jgi:hypothetical protein
MSASKGKSKEQEAKEAELRMARRDALKRMAGLGIALTIPSVLASCGDDDSGYNYYSCKGFECSEASYASGGYSSGGYSSGGYSSYAGYKSSYSSSYYSSYYSYHSQYCDSYGSMYYYSYYCYYS